MTIAVQELTPVSQGGTSYLPSGVIDDGAPVATGGGSVADASDSSYVEIGTWYDAPAAQSHVEPLVLDFFYDGPVAPIAMGIQVRGATPASALASPPDGTRLFWVVYSDPTLAGDPSSTFVNGEQSYLSASVFDPFRLTSQAAPVAVETFWGNSLDRGNPTDSGNWCEIADDAPAGNEMPGAAAALMTTGLRVALYMQQASAGTSEAPTERIPWLNVYAVRLVVAVDAALTLPAPARLVGRDDSGNAHSARRFPPPRSIQGSARRAGSYH